MSRTVRGTATPPPRHSAPSSFNTTDPERRCAASTSSTSSGTPSVRATTSSTSSRGASESRSAPRSSATSLRPSGSRSNTSAMPSCCNARTTCSAPVASRERSAPTISTPGGAAVARYRNTSRLSGSAACKSSRTITAPPLAAAVCLHEPDNSFERKQAQLRVGHPGTRRRVPRPLRKHEPQPGIERPHRVVRPDARATTSATPPRRH